MAISSVTLRRRVDDLEAALPFYERLTGEPAARFNFAGMELARTGPFLLFCGLGEAAGRFAAVPATLAVTDLDATVAE
jgi:hypothetical protein